MKTFPNLPEVIELCPPSCTLFLSHHLSLCIMYVLALLSQGGRIHHSLLSKVIHICWKYIHLEKNKCFCQLKL